MIQPDQVNIANYARIGYNPKDITFEWEEMRDIFIVVMHCSDPSALADAKIQYWQRVWPNQRVPKGAIVGAGGERQSTKKYDAQGNKVIEYGFLPAGSLEDVRDYYWLATNAPTYWGFKNFAKALVDAGHPEGERLLKEAEDFGNDLTAGFRESMVLSPLVKL